MNIEELKKLAAYARSMREMGIALVGASGMLALLLFVPVAPEESHAPSITITAPATPDAFAQISLEAKAAVVYDLVTGETLYEKNADVQLPLASLTKLLTIYAALAELSPATPITVPVSAMHLDGPHIFSAGQTFSLADIARLTLTASLNDGAVAIADATAQRQNLSQSDMLAGAAAALGLSQTYAINGSGLDMSPAVSGGYGSAHDLARLAGALVERAPAIAEATTFGSAEAVSKDGTSFRVLNTDPMTASFPRLLLSKTGYTNLAGGNLALVFDVGINHPVAVVVLGSSMNDRFTDGAALVYATLVHFATTVSL